MVAENFTDSNKAALEKESALREELWRSRVYEALLLADMDDEAALWEQCCSKPAKHLDKLPSVVPPGAAGVFLCEDDRDHGCRVMWHTCDLRFCPTCARRHAARLVHKYSHIVDKETEKFRAGFRLRKIVLTTTIAMTDPNAKTHYEAGFDAVRATLDDLLGKKWIKDQGALVTAEFGEDGHKLHYHVLFHGNFIGQDLLSKSWAEHNMDGSPVVYISDAKRFYKDNHEAVRESLKYACKFWKLDDDGTPRHMEPALIPVLAAILKGTRRVRAWGTFYGAQAPEHKPECPCCHKPMIRIPRDDYQTFLLDAVGMTPGEFVEFRKSGSLNSILANKSLANGPAPPEKPPPEPRQKSLSKGFSDRLTKGTKNNAITL